VRKVAKRIFEHLTNMGYFLEINSAGNLVRETWSGDVTLENYKSAMAELRQHPEYRQGMDGLADYRRARIMLSYNSMTMLASLCSSAEKWRHVAIVVSRVVDYGLARMYQALTESTGSHVKEFRIFMSIEEAERWLASVGSHTAKQGESGKYANETSFSSTLISE